MAWDLGFKKVAIDQEDRDSHCMLLPSVMGLVVLLPDTPPAPHWACPSSSTAPGQLKLYRCAWLTEGQEDLQSEADERAGLVISKQTQRHSENFRRQSEVS